MSVCVGVGGTRGAGVGTVVGVVVVGVFAVCVGVAVRAVIVVWCLWCCC